MSLSPHTSGPTFTPSGSKLAIRKEGHPVPLDSNLEIKTKSAKGQFEIDTIIPQLWASHTLKLVKALHYSGTFENPKVVDMAGEIQRWEARNQSNLRKLVALIKKIVNVTKENGGSAAVRYDARKGKLFICEGEGKKMLPEDLYLKWGDSKGPTDVEAGYGEQSETKGESSAGAVGK
ncbi:MAG: hypothetical protein Q9183_007987, partial [Haloplaca sp. 2 TL-2023]